MLAAKSRLGPYEIEALVGQGGMGEVYRARDARLDRMVAIKVLGQALADGDARQRFEREAKTIARLDHPNICAVHDLGSVDDTDYLVLEYLSGETLAQRLQRGPLPVSDALRIAFEVAAALEAAHRQHIVHRDLKPGNVMLTKSGAKLLDFGLAKPLAVLTAVPGASALETAAAPITARGTILGTLRYMAPEQIEGRDTDARTDVFAFGAMLYEMVTGRAAFNGGSQASIIAAILERDPEPMTAHQPLTPAVLVQVVRGCLEKDPDRRWQTMHDVSSALRLVEASSSGASAASPSPVRSRWRLPLTIAGFALIAVAVTATTLLWTTRTRPVAPTAPLVRFDVWAPPAWSQRLGIPTFSMSADGSTIVYIGVSEGTRRLYVRKLGEGSSVAVPDTEGASEAYVSPDGRTAMFVLSLGPGPAVLRRVSLAGGAPETVGTTGFGSLRGLSWADDGSLILSRGTDSGLWRLPSGSREPVVLTQPDVAKGERSHRWPHLLPNGRGVLFTRVSSEILSFNDATISVYRFDTGESKDLIQGGSYPVYSPTGHVLYARGGSILAVPFDLDRLEVTGPSAVVLNDVLMYPASGGAQLAISKTGVLAVMRGGAVQENSTLMRVDRNGRATAIPFASPYYNGFSISQSGQIALDIDAANASIWIGDLATASARRLTLRWSNNGPAWSPDGKSIVFNSQRGGNLNLFWQPVDSSEAEQLTNDPDDQGAASFSPDGRYLVFDNRMQGSATRDIHLMDLQAGRRITPLIATSFDEGTPRISPDGRWIAYRSDESGTPEIYVQSFPALRQKTLISRGASLSHGVWSKASRELFYIRGDGTMMAVTTPTASAAAFGAPVPLFRWSGRANFDVAPNGDFVVISDASNGLRAVPIEVTVNWQMLSEPRAQTTTR